MTPHAVYTATADTSPHPAVTPFDAAAVRPIFVIGYSRSGTTLLQLLIAAHQGFRTCRETHLFKHALLAVDGWERRSLDETDLETVLDRLSRKSECVLDLAARRRLFQRANGGLGPAELLHEVMLSLIGEPWDKAFRWVEKSPRHAMWLPQILEIFPDARVLHMLRDPRDVVSSRIKQRDFNGAVEEYVYYMLRADEWRAFVERTLAVARGSDRVMDVRYEDLAAEPRATMERVMAFLDAPFEPQSLETFSEQYANVVLPWEHRHKGLCAKGALVNRTGIWRERIPPARARMVECLCASLMQRLGYAPDRPVGPAGRALHEGLLRLWRLRCRIRAQSLVATMVTRRPSA